MPHAAAGQADVGSVNSQHHSRTLRNRCAVFLSENCRWHESKRQSMALAPNNMLMPNSNSTRWESWGNRDMDRRSPEDERNSWNEAKQPSRSQSALSGQQAPRRSTPALALFYRTSGNTSIETTPGQSGQNLLTTAVFAAVAFLFVVHRAIFAGFLAALFVRCKRTCANHGGKDRHQDSGRGFHQD